MITCERCGSRHCEIHGSWSLRHGAQYRARCHRHHWQRITRDEYFDELNRRAGLR